MDERDRSIIAQSSGAQASTIIAALIASGDKTDLANKFDTWRRHIYEGVMQTVGAATTGAGATPAQTAPAAQQPSSNGHFCQHGPREWVTGTSKRTGKDFKGWFCPQKQCEPEFVK